MYQLKPDLFKKEESIAPKQLSAGSPCFVSPECTSWKCVNNVCQDENWCTTNDHCPTDKYYTICNTSISECQYEDQICQEESNKRDTKCKYPFTYCKDISGTKRCKRMNYCENNTHCLSGKICNTQTNECELD